MTSDVYAFYYIPVQLVIGLVAGLVFRRLRPSHTAGSRSESLSLRSMGWKLFPAALVISLPGTVVSSTITAVVFGGITSSGSTVLVQLLHSLGMNLSFYEKQKIICTNSTKNPAKNSLSFLQDSHILA